MKINQQIDNRILLRHIYVATPIAVLLFLMLDFHYRFTLFFVVDPIVLALRILLSSKKISIDFVLPFFSLLVVLLICCWLQ